MATRIDNKETNPYEKIESLVMGRMYELENENAQLKKELALAQAKLEVYDRLATISDSKTSLGFGPPISKEGGM